MAKIIKYKLSLYLPLHKSSIYFQSYDLSVVQQYSHVMSCPEQTISFREVFLVSAQLSSRTSSISLTLHKGTS